MDNLEKDKLTVEVVKTKAILESTVINVCEHNTIDVYGCLLVVLDQLNKIDNIVVSL